MKKTLRYSWCNELLLAGHCRNKYCRDLSDNRRSSLCHRLLLLQTGCLWPIDRLFLSFFSPYPHKRPQPELSNNGVSLYCFLAGWSLQVCSISANISHSRAACDGLKAAELWSSCYLLLALQHWAGIMTFPGRKWRGAGGFVAPISYARWAALAGA